MPLLAAGVVGWQGPSTSTPTDLAVVIDFDSPVANAEQATILRERALGDIDEHAQPFYFELTARSIRAVPETARQSFRSIPFSFRPPTFSGLSLSFVEASEILRKNESVRDTVIGRCAATGTPDCGGVVHGAAIRLVADTEAASALKVRHLVEAAKSSRAKALVLVTAGWPYRDAQRLNLDTAARDLTAGGITLVVWKLPSLVPYEGLVKDGATTLAMRLSGRVVRLSEERDVEPAHATFAHPQRAAAPPITVAAEKPEPPAPPLEETTRDVDPADAVLQRAASYVTRFTKVFSAVFWHERYEQEHRVRRRFNASGTSFTVTAGRRRLESDLLLVWLPADASWIAVRDVIAVDGVARPKGDRRLQALFQQPAVSVDDLRQLATENGRFNIGQIVRTFNEPTLALLFLDEHYVRRFTFARAGEERVGGQRAVMYRFAERGTPTVIQEQDRDVPARGTLWIEPSTGQVLQTSLQLSDPKGLLKGDMTVRYGRNAKLDVLVPLEMRETYTSSSGEQVIATAVYTDFRRFETSGRLIVPQ